MVVLFLGEERCLVSGKEDRGSCLEVLGERTKRKGVWLIWLVRHLEEDSWSLKGRTGRELM